jgi:hypothetical protein
MTTVPPPPPGGAQRIQSYDLLGTFVSVGWGEGGEMQLLLGGKKKRQGFDYPFKFTVAIT